MLYTFYGDDFTGSTDVLEQLANGGVRAALFLQPPTPADFELIPNLQAFGIAGDSRSQTPQWMSANLPAIFQRLHSFHAPITHYKVCSTFDSSPTRGSIGRAIELGLDAFPASFVPIVVGAPHLQRFVSEGNLFASGPLGNVHRIDRHPMRDHPITPMREPNLRRHLAAQTSLAIGEVTHSEISANTLPELLLQRSQSNQAIVFDTIDLTDLTRIGASLWSLAQQHPLFAVGSSGLTTALISAWETQGLLQKQPSQNEGPSPRQPGRPLLVVSGSCSAATARQLRWALAHNFHGLPISPQDLHGSSTTLPQRTIANATKLLSEGHDVILYTTIGQPTSTPQGAELGSALGKLLHEILQKTSPRVLLCGGDTSSHAIQQLGLRALTWQRNLQPGAPICSAHSMSIINGLELVLKGGQVGTEDFFAVVRDAIT